MSENTENKYFTLLENVNRSNNQVLKSNKEFLEMNRNLLEFLKCSFFFEANSEEFFQEKEEELKRIIGTIPNSVETELSPMTKTKIDQLEKRITFLNKSVRWTFGSLALSVVILFFFGYISFHWYKSSIRTKAEIRQEIFQEIQSKGDRIVEKKKFDEVQSDINAINAWLKIHPEEAKEFYKFKEGFDAKKEN